MKIGYLVLIGTFLLLWAVPVQAHFLAVDGSIGATLHIDPDDSPVAGQPATFYFDIADRANRFTLANCQCQASLSQAGHELIRSSIGQPGFSYVLPRPDVYTVHLKGTPKKTGDFEPFTISWEVRADRSVAAPSVAGSTVRNQAVSGLVFSLVLLAGLFYVRRLRSPR